jgi:4-nitrophenyl phosphatase
MTTAAATLGEDTSSQMDARARLRAAKAFIFDMDGVLYRGSHPLPGVNDLFNALELRERHYILATNNSMSSPQQYVEKLAAMGVNVPVGSISTAGTATRDYLMETLAPDAKIFLIGMPALEQQIFEGTPFTPVHTVEEGPDAVVAGLDLHFTYDKLKTAAVSIRNGAAVVATNADATLPTEAGLVPGAGSIIAAITTASGVQPVVIGKPSPRVLELSVERLGLTPAQGVMVGDRLDTDILAGHRAGLLTALVLTGVSTREDLASAEVMPDLIFTDLPAMLEEIVGNDR